jgi:hypothetical protein
MSRKVHIDMSKKYRNKKTGTVYVSVVPEFGGLVTVTTEAGSTYIVRASSLEESDE